MRLVVFAAAVAASAALGVPKIAVADQMGCQLRANPDRSGDPQAIMRVQMAGSACETQPARSEGRTPMPPAGTNPPTGWETATPRPP